MKHAFPFLLFTALAATPALSQNMDDIAQLDVLDGGQTERGTYLGALRLTLADGWKTYWRAPGDAGIPPSFDWGPSRNLGGIEITWPSPEVQDQNGMRTIGYTEQLVLPIEISPRNANKPVRLRGSIDVGICKEVCLPATFDFDQKLDANAERNPAIAAAFAQRPYSSKEAGVTSVSCRLMPTGQGVRIKAQIAMPSAGGTEVAVFEPGDPSIWAAPSETRRQGNTLISTSEFVAERGGPMALDRSEIRITVLGSNHAVDIQGCPAAPE
ncbi:MAG: protein-disulfide reductase DsbD domain-containing protein [Paracoccaceae bacterium]